MRYFSVFLCALFSALVINLLRVPNQIYDLEFFFTLALVGFILSAPINLFLILISEKSRNEPGSIEAKISNGFRRYLPFYLAGTGFFILDSYSPVHPEGWIQNFIDEKGLFLFLFGEVVPAAFVYSFLAMFLWWMWGNLRTFKKSNEFKETVAEIKQQHNSDMKVLSRAFARLKKNTSDISVPLDKSKEDIVAGIIKRSDGIFLRDDIFCAWCGSYYLYLRSNVLGRKVWDYRNQDGSRDRRVKDNNFRQTFIGEWQCPNCAAKTQTWSFLSYTPSIKTDVHTVALIEPGVGERLASDYSDENAVTVRGANRKNSS